VLLVGLAGAVALHYTAAGPVLHTIDLGQGQQAIGLALDPTIERVVVTTGSPTNTPGRVLVVDSATGALVGTSVLPDHPGKLTLDARHHRIFMLDFNLTAYFLTILDARTGKIVKHTPLAPAASTPWLYVDERHGRVWLAGPVIGNGDNLLVFDSATDHLVFTRHVPGTPLLMAVSGSSAMILGSRVGGVNTTTLLDARTGHLLHRGAVSLPPGSLKVVDDATTGHALVIDSDAPGIPGSVYLFDLQHGAILRSLVLGSVPIGAAVDDQTGHALVVTASPSTNSTATTSNGVTAMAFPTGPGRAHLLNMRGRLIHSVNIGVAPQVIIVAESQGLFFVANAGSRDQSAPIGIGSKMVMMKAPVTAPGSVTELDAKAGTVVRTVTIGWSPQAIVVDQRTRHAFVLDAGSVTPIPVPDPWDWIPRGLRHWLPFLSTPSGTQVVPARLFMLDISR